MAAATFDLTIPKGADVNFTLRITDSKLDPVSFSGSAAFRAEIREAPNRPLAAAFGFQTADGWGPLAADATLASGQVKFVLTKDYTSRLEVGRNYVWDFWFADSTGFVDQLIAGSVTVTAGITSLPII
jgi:hypothetical protein